MSTHNIYFHGEIRKIFKKKFLIWSYAATYNRHTDRSQTLHKGTLPALVAELDAHPTGDPEVVDTTPARSATFFGGDLIMKYFLWSFSPYRLYKKGSCQFLVKDCAQYWLNS